jgi:hypothetical protein
VAFYRWRAGSVRGQTIAPYFWQILSHQSAAGILSLIAPIRPLGHEVGNLIQYIGFLRFSLDMGFSLS